jgi:hypothetical protein
MLSTRYSYYILVKLEVSRRIFEKEAQISNIIQIRLVTAELFHTDGHDEANSRFSQFCEGA